MNELRRYLPTHAHSREENKRLEHHGAAGCEAGHLLATGECPPLLGSTGRQCVQEHRVVTTRWAGEADDLALPDAHADVVQNKYHGSVWRRETPVDVLAGKQGRLADEFFHRTCVRHRGETDIHATSVMT